MGDHSLSSGTFCLKAQLRIERNRTGLPFWLSPKLGKTAESWRQTVVDCVNKGISLLPSQRPHLTFEMASNFPRGSLDSLRGLNPCTCDGVSLASGAEDFEDERLCPLLVCSFALKIYVGTRRMSVYTRIMGRDMKTLYLFFLHKSLNWMSQAITVQWISDRFDPPPPILPLHPLLPPFPPPPPPPPFFLFIFFIIFIFCLFSFPSF